MNNTFPFDIPYSERSLAIACTRGRHAVVSQFSTLLNEANLTEQQWRVLRIIADFAPLPLSEVSRRSCIHKVSMTRIIRTLCDRGLIFTEKDCEDQRSQKADLTEAGRAFVEKLRPKSEAIARGIVERFGAENATQLLKLLNKLAQLSGA
ncbi:MarR family transcriptional regulator [Psychromarinibacter halotolerans]|uniref:MarR family transcriptional regulator n=1 Tax=Psychromarinibacter halotolerans TaxID=1775175 RepID=A0ABV7GMG6_9RHOB|nr:MarR family transcriptional regulator [Psychromarinibacter halotolerans]MDF0599040.1 MarR family transcriptional regulator [Psychromarinibacter halotolerans]